MPDATRLLVVTDLDATLLDAAHRFDEARPALDALALGGHPLVLASSKTLAELRALAAELDVTTPLIAENGGVIAWPDPDDPHGRWTITTTGADRPTLLRHAHTWRDATGARFEGFADWTDADVAAHTGLSLPAAALARDRHATEPLLWQDTDALRVAFEGEMARHGLRLLRGGRFWHLMGAADKADGLRAVRERLVGANPDIRWFTVALGDSPNDVAMLQAADLAVIIPNPARDTPLVVRHPRVLRATSPGPAGWNRAMLDILQSLPEEP